MKLENENKTVQVAKENVRAFKLEVERINRRAQRVGIDPIVYQVGEPRLVKKTVLTTETLDGESRKKSNTFPVEVCDVTLSVPSPDSYKWRVLAIATRMEDGSTFIEPRVVGLDVKDLSKRINIAHCDHCHTVRRRNMSYLIRNTETGEELQVAQNCFKDYVGAEGLAVLEFIDFMVRQLSLDEEEWEPSGARIRNRSAYSVLHLIAWAEAFFARDGKWTFNQKDEDGRVITPGTHRWAADAIQLAPSCETGFKAETYKAMQDPTWPGFDRAQKIITQISQMPVTEDDEFATTLQYCCQFDVVPREKAALVAYAGQYLRQLEAKARLEARKATARHLGVVGERSEFPNLTLVKISSYQSEGFGTRYINIFEDAEGNVLVWKTSAPAGGEGEKLSLKATVKEHGEFRGLKQTIVSRAKVVEEKAEEPTQEAGSSASRSSHRPRLRQMVADGLRGEELLAKARAEFPDVDEARRAEKGAL